MSASFDDRVLDYVLGGLPEDEVAAFEAELARSVSLRAQVREAEELLVASAAALTPIAPSADLRERVLASALPARWESALDRVAHLWDLSVAQVRAVFGRAMDPSTWEDGPLPGIRLFHLEGGPAVAGADVGIISFPPGLVFPPHAHGERESYVVLQGELYDSTGLIERAGDLVHRPGQPSHHFSTTTDGPTVIALVLRGGLEFG